MTRRSATGIVRPLLLCLTVAGLAGCASGPSDELRNADLSTNVVDETGLGALMLGNGDIEAALQHFNRVLAKRPNDTEALRGLAATLSRARRYEEAAEVFARLDEAGQLTDEDRARYALALTRSEEWAKVVELAEAEPAETRSERLGLLLALAYDHSDNWAAADREYARVLSVAARPEQALNNWGMSQLARGNVDEAVDLLQRALDLDPNLKTARTNLVIANAMNGNFAMLPFKMDQEERAMHLYNMGVLALRAGDRAKATEFFVEATETHPQHYFKSFDMLERLETSEGV